VIFAGKKIFLKKLHGKITRSDNTRTFKPNECLLNCMTGRQGGYCNPIRIPRHIHYSSIQGTPDQKHKLQTVLPAYSLSA